MPNPDPLPKQAARETAAQNTMPEGTEQGKYLPNFEHILYHHDPLLPRPTGQQQKWNPDGIALELERYTRLTRIPILKEFTSLIPRLTYDYMREMSDSCEALARAIKKALEKKEANIEKGILFYKLNPTAGIFSLKQLGWSDKIEQKIDLGLTAEQKGKIDTAFSAARNRVAQQIAKASEN